MLGRELFRGLQFQILPNWWKRVCRFFGEEVGIIHQIELPNRFPERRFEIFFELTAHAADFSFNCCMNLKMQT